MQAASLVQDEDIIRGALVSSRSLSGPLTANNGDILREAAIHSQGIAVLPDFLVEDELQAGRLQRILPEYHLEEYGVYAVWASRKFTPLKTREFVEFLAARLGNLGPESPMTMV